MSSYVKGMKVPPCSRQDLRNLAAKMHGLLRYDGKSPFPVVDVVELVLPEIIPGFDFQILPEKEMGADHGRTYPDRHLMLIRQDVYDRACMGHGRDRFTIGHELSHQLLHEGVDVALARSDNQHKTFEDSEWQADALAGELLMPHSRIRNLSVGKIVDIYQVSPSAARTQLRAA
ncbi:Zn peptidase [Gordonibacter sp. An232A]|nr:Zn peptidase [Gordonibacter sp. An232A]